ncbi:hypothetical protein [Bradyrhizobium lablabi]|uniref:hypothetical protein n=1 Tax=Bradyrhizobium lablabi TaxID=722472 RepID=UPI001BA97755|nr:hypothetical protein [Bradyrhizobium lablabi]MBR0693536.1 hypothetical protein [Bradyrhizobium lablabi]
MTALVPKILARASRAADAFHMRLKKARPALFGPPIRQNMIQLYRHDADFDTIVSIPHHLSFLAPDTNIDITYALRVFDRHGGLVGSCEHQVKHFETLQEPLSKLLGRELDEHGMFVVSCHYSSPSGIDFLGMTSPQFMTIFMPRGERTAPQITHSHLYMDRVPPLKSKYPRRSALLEGDANLTGISYFLMNSSQATTNVDLTLSGPASSLARSVRLKPFGTGRVDMDAVGEGPFELTYELDRAINHRKPIAFRRFASGLITAAHS